jgi:hypothetical protein
MEFPQDLSAKKFLAGFVLKMASAGSNSTLLNPLQSSESGAKP